MWATTCTSTPDATHSLPPLTRSLTQLTHNGDGDVHRGGPQLVLDLQGVDSLVGLEAVVDDEGGVQVGARDVQAGGQGLDLLQRLALPQPLHLGRGRARDGDAHLDGVPAAEAQAFAVVRGQVDVCWGCLCWRSYY